MPEEIVKEKLKKLKELQNAKNKPVLQKAPFKIQPKDDSDTGYKFFCVLSELN